MGEGSGIRGKMEKEVRVVKELEEHYREKVEGENSTQMKKRC